MRMRGKLKLEKLEQEGSFDLARILHSLFSHHHHRLDRRVEIEKAL
jgi:hypothetical protein